MIADAGEVFDASAANEDGGVFLEVVPFAADVGGDFVSVGEADARDLSQGGVGLARLGGVDAQTDPPLLRAGFQGGRGGFRLFDAPRTPGELIEGRHCFLVLRKARRPEKFALGGNFAL